MKTNSFKRIAQFLGVTALLTLGSSAMAATTWNFSTCNGTAGNQASTNSGDFGNSWSCAGVTGSNKVTVSGWGGSSSATGFQTAFVSPQGGSGFGLASQYEGKSATSPDHAADNDPVSLVPDLFVLKFDSAVALDKVTLGWNKNDADFTLMAYTGGTLTVKDKNASNLATGGGWSLVQQVGNQGVTQADASTSVDVERTVNNGSNPVTSSWWLVSAYSASYNNSTALDTKLDYFKLFSVASKDLPEPGSLALFGLGLVGVLASRRRSQKAA